MQDFRLFISSPGDAAVERRRTENVVSRLNGEFAELARLTTVRWETEAYQAYATFQTQIPPATDCDIVVGILRWRLGTELPPDFERLPSGESYASGTAFEILTAIDKRHQGADLPDVFVFRYGGGAPLSRSDDPTRAAIDRDWAALQAFLARWFLTPQGHFVAALNGYRSEDDFEQQLERLLRKWLADKVAAGRAVLWPKAKGSPFRALNAFGAKHVPVFFGRAADVRRIMDLWRDYAARGQRFLLIVGASGAGKSSLAHAGVVPRLTTPGVVPEVDLWRVAVTRPGDSPQGPFAALAAALMQAATDLPPEEEGREAALPEIAEGDSRTPAELAAVLAHADASAVKPILNALTAIGTRAKAREHHDREMRCDLVLLIDQLDELFAPSLAPAAREKFADLVAALVASGRVWIAATLRADLYAAMLKVPALKALKDDGASYDLAPPGQVELAEIVRAPAAAAGLTFAADPATGERLDERLLREADRPDLLPLMQLALARLWEARETQGGETVLPFAAFAASGGVKGIIAEAGEGALAKVDEASRGKLAPLIRRLAELTRGQTGGTSLTARAAPLAEAAPDAAGRVLVDALVEARLLTLAEEAGTTTVRLAHQRVLGDWPRAERIVAESADFYRVRDDVEAQRRRWDEGRRHDEFLLRGRALSDARDVAARYGGELSPATRAFTAASRRRATRAQTIGWAAAAVFAIVAVAAGIEAKLASDRQLEADRQKEIAERNFNAAEDTVGVLIVEFAEGLRKVSGMHTFRAFLERLQTTLDTLVKGAPDDRRLLQIRSLLDNYLVDTYLESDDTGSALDLAGESLEIAKKLSMLNPADAETQRDLSFRLWKIGDVKLRAEDKAGALSAYQQAFDIFKKLATSDSGNAEARRGLELGLERIGNAKLQGGNRADALGSYEESLSIARKLALDPGNAQAQGDVSVILNRIGMVKLQAGDQAGALAAYRESLAIARGLAARDPGNAQANRDVSLGLWGIGDVQLRIRDQAGALAAYQQALDIFKKLAALDPVNAEVQNDVSVSFNKIGNAKVQADDKAGALAAYRESLAIARELAARDPDNAQAQRHASVILAEIGDVKVQGGDRAGALAIYQELLAIEHKLAAQDPGDAEEQWDLVGSLLKVASVSESPASLYREAIDILEALDRDGHLAPSRKWAIEDLRRKLAASGATSP